MDDYKYQMRRHKRGDWCLACGSRIDPKTGKKVHFSFKCGCGVRVGPNKKHKKRIVKRALKRDLRERFGAYIYDNRQ